MFQRMLAGMVVFTYLAIFGPLASSAGEPEPLTLARAVGIALEKSPLVQAARHQVEASEAGVRGARSHFLPKLEVREGFHRSDNPVFVFSLQL